MKTRSLHLLIYLLSALVSLAFFSLALPNEPSQYVSIPLKLQGTTFRLTQWYAGVATLYLYIALLISPLYHVFRKLAGKTMAVNARKAIGVSAFAFALLHSFFGYGLFGGLAALPFFGPAYNWSLAIGLVALIILTVMAVTSNDTIHKNLGVLWKKIHQWVYAAGILILFHVFLITTHLAPNEFILSVIGFVLLSFLFILESIRLNDYLQKKKKHLPKHAVSWAGSILSVAVLFWAFFILYHPH